MAIVNNGVKNSLPDGNLPSGYTKPAVTEFEDYEYTNDLKLTVLKSAVENANGAVTMAAIVADLVSQIDAILAADYISTQTVDAWSDLISMNNNYKSLRGDADWLTTTAASYNCTINFYVKTA